MSGKHNKTDEQELCDSAENADIEMAMDPGWWFREPPGDTSEPDADKGLTSIGNAPPTKRQRLSAGDDCCDGSPEDAKLAEDAEPEDETPQTRLIHYGNVIAKASAVAFTHAIKEVGKVICDGRGCCYSNAIAGGLAGVRNK